MEIREKAEYVFWSSRRWNQIVFWGELPPDTAEAQRGKVLAKNAKWSQRIAGLRMCVQGLEDQVWMKMTFGSVGRRNDRRCNDSGQRGGNVGLTSWRRSSSNDDSLSWVLFSGKHLESVELIFVSSLLPLLDPFVLVSGSPSSLWPWPELSDCIFIIVILTIVCSFIPEPWN